MLVKHFSVHSWLKKCTLSVFFRNVCVLVTSYTSVSLSRASLAVLFLPIFECSVYITKGAAKSLTRLFFLLAAPLGSCIEHHLLHLLQLLLQTGKVEVCTLLCHGCEVYGSTQYRPGMK